MSRRFPRLSNAKVLLLLPRMLWSYARLIALFTARPKSSEGPEPAQKKRRKKKRGFTWKPCVFAYAVSKSESTYFAVRCVCSLVRRPRGQQVLRVSSRLCVSLRHTVKLQAFRWWMIGKVAVGRAKSLFSIWALFKLLLKVRWGDWLILVHWIWSKLYSWWQRESGETAGHRY